MAVQKSKKSRSKRGMRRAHIQLHIPNFYIKDKKCNLYHHINDDGWYRNKQYFFIRKK